MAKAFVDTLISNMKKAGIVTKATPWVVEGMGDKQMNVRYVGIKPFADWTEIIAAENNLLLKFVTDRTQSYFELFLANKPPFVWVTRKNFTDADKWELLLGDIKRRLNKDKEEVVRHEEKAGNLFVVLKPHLK
ncbi:MAG: hypothetical protein KGJ07_03125 [Patescibacteria group bacterium]|nr:hypothetical protein [Patescibacteria group bacterium]MDE2589802.1 hypothetical protein [Patescibacteria group bacterium]